MIDVEKNHLRARKAEEGGKGDKSDVRGCSRHRWTLMYNDGDVPYGPFHLSTDLNVSSIVPDGDASNT